MEVDRE